MTNKDRFKVWFNDYYPKMGGYPTMKDMVAKAAWDAWKHARETGWAYVQGFNDGKEYTLQKAESLMDERIRELEKPLNKYKFNDTYCSQCGKSFGPGDHGYSHCDNHD